jgi:L-amino acid N-acyltransferase YncA
MSGDERAVGVAETEGAGGGWGVVRIVPGVSGADERVEAVAEVQDARRRRIGSRLRRWGCRGR